jgi:hypothetical protein
VATKNAPQGYRCEQSYARSNYEERGVDRFRPIGMENTGTMAFIAYDIFTEEGIEGKFSSYIFTIATHRLHWYCCGSTADSKTERRSGTQHFKNGSTANMINVVVPKQPLCGPATPSYALLAARSLVRFFLRKRTDRDELIDRNLSVQESSDDEVIEEVWSLIRKAGLDVLI